MHAKKTPLKKSLLKFKKKSLKSFDNTKHSIKNGLNINKYNKFLFIFEAVLFVAVLDEFLESIILGLNLSLYLNIFLFMILTGTLFTFVFSKLEPMLKKILTWTVRLNQNKILRVFTHMLILALLVYLYALVFFDTSIGLVFNVQLTS